MSRMDLAHLTPNDESGVVVTVYKSIGDSVVAGEVVLEIETTKAVLEVPSSVSGTVSYIARAGSRLRLGDRVIEVDAGADSPAPAGAPAPPMDEGLRRRMSDEAFALIQGSGREILAALPPAGLITAKLVRAILEGRPSAASPAADLDLEGFLGARSNEKFCAYMVSHPFDFRPEISEESLACGMASRSADFLALLVKGPSRMRFSLALVVDLNGIPLLVELDPDALRSVETIGEARLERILQLRREGRVVSFATRSTFAISTLKGSHISHHFPIVPENHAAVFGLLISPRGCSVTLGYDHRRLTGFNAARMLDLAVSLLAGENAGSPPGKFESA